MTLQAPFPWFGGKRRVAPEVWARFGDVPNYVEPFAGSLAVLLGRPEAHARKIETVNDLDGFIANFWRDAEIERERAMSERVTDINLDVATTLTRGNWPTRVFNATCVHFDIDGDDLLSDARDRPTVIARQVAMWVMRAGDMPLATIGREFGKDHTTVIHGIRRVEASPELLADARTIYEALAGPMEVSA